MTQQSRCEWRLNAAKSEHDEAQYYTRRSCATTRDVYQREYARVQRRLGRLRVVDGLFDYEDEVASEPWYDDY